MRFSVTDMYFSTNICVYGTNFQQLAFGTELCQEHQALRPESRDGPDLHALPLLGGRGAEDPRVPRRCFSAASSPRCLSKIFLTRS